MPSLTLRLEIEEGSLILVLNEVLSVTRTTSYSVSRCASLSFIKLPNQPMARTALMCLNWLAQVWMRMGRIFQECSDWQRFTQARSKAHRAVRTAKDAWFTSKVEEAQQSRFGGKKVWKCIRDMHYGRRGLVSSRLTTVVTSWWRKQPMHYCVGTAATVEEALH